MQIKYLTDGIFETSDWVEVAAYSSTTQNYFIIEDGRLKVIPKEFVTTQYYENISDNVLSLIDFLEFRLGQLDLKEDPDFSLVDLRDNRAKTSH